MATSNLTPGPQNTASPTISVSNDANAVLHRFSQAYLTLLADLSQVAMNSYQEYAKQLTPENVSKIDGNGFVSGAASSLSVALEQGPKVLDKYFNALQGK